MTLYNVVVVVAVHINIRTIGCVLTVNFPHGDDDDEEEDTVGDIDDDNDSGGRIGSEFFSG